MEKPTVIFDSCGSSGNIYAVLALARDALRRARRIADFNECQDRVFNSGSYKDALKIIGGYVNLVDVSGETL